MRFRPLRALTLSKPLAWCPPLSDHPPAQPLGLRGACGHECPSYWPFTALGGLLASERGQGAGRGSSHRRTQPWGCGTTIAWGAPAVRAWGPASACLSPGHQDFQKKKNRAGRTAFGSPLCGMQVLLFQNQCGWAQGPEFTFPTVSNRGPVAGSEDLGAFHIIRCGARAKTDRR